MERHARRSALLDIDPAWGRRLTALRVDANVEVAPELDVDRVRGVEATIGARIPDPILALVATGVPWLESALGLSLARFADHTARARNARAPGDFVGVAASPDGRTVYGFRPGRSPDQIVAYDADRRTMKQRPLERWLTEVIEACRDGRCDLEGLEGLESLQARMIRAALPPGEGQRVRHRTWGEGRVLAEHGEGPTRKVKAEFPGLGLKVVQARFLEFIES
jgi:hypothetical protein